MGLIQEFRDFAIKGNVLDLAVAVIIGSAFGKIVDSVVKDLLTPIIPTGVAGQSFADAKLGQIAYGNFINNVISFLIVAFVMFLIVKAANRFKKPVAAPIDLAALNAEQNKEIIALLKQIAEKKAV